MKLVTLVPAVAVLAGCVEETGMSGPIGVMGQEQACAGQFADMVGTPMSNIRTNGRDTSPAGNTVVFLQTADLGMSAICEIDDFGNVVELNIS